MLTSGMMCRLSRDEGFLHIHVFDICPESREREECEKAVPVVKPRLCLGSIGQALPTSSQTSFRTGAELRASMAFLIPYVVCLSSRAPNNSEARSGTVLANSWFALSPTSSVMRGMLLRMLSRH